LSFFLFFIFTYELAYLNNRLTCTMLSLDG
jgi:hypothetical protein